MPQRSSTPILALIAVVAMVAAACAGSSGSARTVKGCELTVDADCPGADLGGANLGDAQLRRANFRGADLSDANLTNTNLINADLRRADLSGANLTKANLRHADLRGAILDGANLGRANLGRARLEDASLVLAQAQRADLSRPRARGLDLSGANLEDAKVGSQVLAQAILCGTTRPNGRIDNSDCENGSSEGSPTTTTLAVAPYAIDRFIGPLGYNCDSGDGQATFSWAVPNTGSVAFTVDGTDPSGLSGGLPAIVDNPNGQSFGSVDDGTVTFAFACDDQPHVVTFTWVEGSSPGVPIPGGPALTRSTTLTRTG